MKGLLTEEAEYRVEDAGSTIRRKLAADPEAQAIFIKLAKDLQK
jgi:hypothetical protein